MALIEALTKPILSLSDVAFLLGIPLDTKEQAGRTGRKEWRRRVIRAIERLEERSGLSLRVELPYSAGKGAKGAPGIVTDRLRKAMPELFEGLDNAAGLRISRLEAEVLQLKRRLSVVESKNANTGDLLAQHDRTLQRMARKGS